MIGKDQEDEERDGGMCTGCDGEEEFTSPIRIWSEEIDKCFFACVFNFERGS